MQIRCTYCHKPFAMGKEELQLAVEMFKDEDLTHYDARCPHCRKVNRVSKDEILRAAPDRGKESAEA